MMLGGVICGYCATGKLTTATAPARVMTSDSTEAKIGRRMKKWENMATTGRHQTADSRESIAGLRARLFLSGVLCLMSDVFLSRGQQPAQRRLRPLRRRLMLGLHLHAGADALHAADDDAVAGLE